jgi:hypothetical protein
LEHWQRYLRGEPMPPAEEQACVIAVAEALPIVKPSEPQPPRPAPGPRMTRTQQRALKRIRRYATPNERE